MEQTVSAHRCYSLQEASRIVGWKTLINVRKLAAFLGSSLPNLYTHKVDSNLYSCHVDVSCTFHRLWNHSSAQTLSAAFLTTTIAVRVYEVNGSRTSSSCEPKINSWETGFPRVPTAEPQRASPRQGITMYTPQIPLEWSETMPNRIKGNNLQPVLQACGLNAWRGLWFK